MDFLPTILGTRPRLAVEVRAEGVVAARAEDAAAMLAAVVRNGLPDGALAPGLKPGNIVDKDAVVEAVRKALDGVAGTGRERSRDVTLVVPDSAVRVLFLDFDQLPSKRAEALPVVRFRLKKLLPFDADDAAVSYQVMSSSKGVVQVMAVAMPREVLAEYESVVREAGFEPGAVLPSTLAALAGLGDGDRPTLVVNANREGVTTAIVKGGLLLLHRTVDLGADARGPARTAELPGEVALDRPGDNSIAAIAARLAAAGTQAPVSGSVAANAATNEVAQAVSVAAAYFEDTLETAPAVVLAAGTLGADALTVVLDAAGVGPVAVQEVVGSQMLGAGAASAGTPGGVPLGWLAGVRGALAN